MEDFVDLKLQSFQMGFGLKIELIGWVKVFIIGFDKTSNEFWLLMMNNEQVSDFYSISRSGVIQGFVIYGFPPPILI